MEKDITALICCNAFGGKVYSTKRKGVGREQVNWGEHFYFSKEFTVKYVIFRTSDRQWEQKCSLRYIIIICSKETQR